MTIKQIREDLREIQFYYSKQKSLDYLVKTVAQNSILEKVQKYHEAVKDAPIRLYGLYMALYVENNTQGALAYEWTCSESQIKVLSQKLCEFLIKTFKDDDKND